MSTQSHDNATEKQSVLMGWLIPVWHWAIPIAILIGVYAWQTRHLLPAGEPVPALHLPTLAGATSALATPGKPTLLYFFAPWCNVCGLSVGNLQVVDNDAMDIKLIALDYQSTKELRDFVAQHAIDLPILLGNQALKQHFAISAYPTYYMLNNRSQVVASDRGYSTSLGLWIRKTMAAL